MLDLIGITGLKESDKLLRLAIVAGGVLILIRSIVILI